MTLLEETIATNKNLIEYYKDLIKRNKKQNSVLAQYVQDTRTWSIDILTEMYNPYYVVTDSVSVLEMLSNIQRDIQTNAPHTNWNRSISAHIGTYQLTFEDCKGKLINNSRDNPEPKYIQFTKDEFDKLNLKCYVNRNIHHKTQTSNKKTQVFIYFTIVNNTDSNVYIEYLFSTKEKIDINRFKPSDNPKIFATKVSAKRLKCVFIIKPKYKPLAKLAKMEIVK